MYLQQKSGNERADLQCPYQRPSAVSGYIGLLYEVDESDTATYYHFDQSGSTIALTDAGGAVTDRFEYSSYGVPTHRTGTTDTPFQYNGKYNIITDENGLLHMRTRYYSPELLRSVIPRHPCVVGWF